VGAVPIQQCQESDVSEAAQHLRSVLEPVVAGHGLCLEGVSVRPAGKRRLVLVTVDLPDGPGGVGSDALADVSRAVSEALDEVDVLPGAYVLEVSTPGTDRPLSAPRHYRRAVGRLVHLRLRSGERLSGRLVGADEDGLELDVGDAGGARRRLAFADLAGGTVEVELRGVEEEGEA
jgi:ribosome maturation factor RimP